MSCTDFQGVKNTTWFPSGGSSTALDMVQSIAVNQTASYSSVSGDADERARSFTKNVESTDGSLTTKNIKEAANILSFGILGVLDFDSTDECLGGSGETVSVTIESTVWTNRSMSFQVASGSAPSLSFQSSSAGLDGETDPVTYVFA